MCKLVKWVKGLFAGKGYHFKMPDMHTKITPRHNERYDFVIQSSGVEIPMPFTMSDNRINPERRGLTLLYSELMLQPGFTIWMSPKTIFNWWDSKLTKVKFKIVHCETKEVLVDWTDMDVHRGHPQ